MLSLTAAQTRFEVVELGLDGALAFTDVVHGLAEFSHENLDTTHALFELDRFRVFVRVFARSGTLIADR